MAYTKIIKVKSNLNLCLDYTSNPMKTERRSAEDLNKLLNYTQNNDKTEHQLYVSGFNCIPQNAYEIMMETKTRWRKPVKDGNILAYHIIQSFAPGEATPDQVHQIGCEFVQRFLADRFECTVSTHLDRGHLHMFAADARKHTPGKNAEKENFSMRILVCDDDAAFAGQLAEKIEAIVKPQMPRSTVDCATDAAQLRALPLAKYDLAFLDIDMGPLNGVDLARRLHELRPDMLLIFVTNYVEYSLQGYEVQAFRYLLKAEMPQKLERYVQQALTAYRKTRDTVRIFCDGEDVELQPQQILYAEMSARKVCLHLQGADRALLYTTATMADLADLLENHGFVRTHKSVLVNMEHIRDLQSTRLYLRDGTELPVSSHTASAVRKIYTQWRSAKKWVIG